MYIGRVGLQNFRNIESLDLNLNQGFIVLFGPNGAGKTNFLEGVYFGTRLGRFPDGILNDLFLGGQDFFGIQIDVQNTDLVHREVFYERRDGKVSATLKMNNQKISRREYVGGVGVVKFLPEDLSLMTGSPRRRRNFFDDVLSQVSFKYDYALKQYEKIIRQRNELLSKFQGQRGPLDELEAWDLGLIEYGSEITSQRKSFLDFVNAKIKPIMKNLSPELSEIGLVYDSSGDSDPGVFAEKLQISRIRERELGVSLTGPHRDDFQAKILERSVAGFVSRGQMRALVLALKFLERDFLVANTQKPPLILLDDVLSEFDSDHQRNLLNFLQDQKQVFLTTAHGNELKNLLPTTSQIFFVDRGQLIKANDV